MAAPLLETRIRSANREVVIGHQTRFCVIGERINPTGRRIFQEQLRAGDLSAVERDVKAQVEGGADVLDVNMGVPLTDEADLLARAITMVQELTDLPICIDSSVVEALEAGLSVYRGRALVNSVTAEDERLEQILPLVKKHDAAVIALPNDEDEIPMEPEKRLELVAKIVRVATQEYGIAQADIVIDPLAMPIGADQSVALAFFTTVSRIREEYGLNMTCGASNTSFGMPGRHQIGAAFLPMAMAAGLTSAIMDARSPEIVTAVKAADLLLGHASAVRVPPGVSVFDAASWNGIAIDSTCGGHGTCHKCRIRIAGETLPITRHDVKSFTPEQIADGWRLACLIRAHRSMAVDVPPLTTRPQAATVGVGRQVILRPACIKRYVELDEPTLSDQRPDLVRLTDALPDLEVSADLPVLRRLPTVLRGADFKVTAVVIDETLVDVEPGDTTQRRYALAVDLGTTTVVATLLDLRTGTPVAVASMLNRQQPFGADVISRISATMIDPPALERLHTAAGETLAELAAQVCAEGGVDPHDVYEVALAGNATMTALALGIPPEPLGVAPFVMSTARPPDLLAADLGLALHPRARATVLPALGAYVGGDVVAGMLASGMDRDKRTRLFIDVGTNCEIVLSDGDTLLATAAPAGPAFEGGAIRCGMRAAAGAIETVALGDGTSGEVDLGVIGDEEPRGLCGSGLVDATSELVRLGLLDGTGRLVSADVAAELTPALADRMAMVGEERVFLLHRPTPTASPEECVYLSQRDVRELQFAKAAISTGWSLLLDELGLDPAEVQQVLLAGSFGTYLSPAAAVRIGLVPDLALRRIVAAGNVAGEGARMVLLSLRERAGARALLEEVTYVELSDRPDFNDRFVEQLGFPG
jgi:uncharacterized 2Fe-2S/4Fe-4S cluster protein (DUF4445 family)